MHIRLVNAFPVDALTSFNQDLNLKSIATSTLTASDSVSTSQTQSASQPQQSLPTAIHTSTVTPRAQSSAFVALSTFGTGSSSRPATTSPFSSPTQQEFEHAPHLVVAFPVSSLIDVVPTQSHAIAAITQDTSSPSVHPGPKTARGASTILQPSILTNDLNQSIPNSETVLAKSSSVSVTPPISDINSGLMPSTHTDKADSNPNDIHPTSRVPTPTLDATLDSKMSSIVPFLQTGNTDTLFASDSSSSLSPQTTIMSDLYMNQPLMATSVQTTTANSLNHYSLGNQTLTPGNIITLSSTKTSLTRNGSDVIVGPSTEVLRPSVTAKISSISNGTDTQIFRGHAVGVGDGLWGSSVLLLVGMAVLLRL